jgi:hypothetical protein
MSQCKRPNIVQKENWKVLRKDPAYVEAVGWISEILEENCFPSEARKARKQ